MKSPKSLERLRDRVAQAADEILRLREENLSLVQRLQELEARQNQHPAGNALYLDGDPEKLRRQIEGFIAAIDQYLNQEALSSQPESNAAPSENV